MRRKKGWAHLRNFSGVLVKGLLGKAEALKLRLPGRRARSFPVLLGLLGLGVLWGPQVPLAAAQPQQATDQEFRPGQSVVVIQPTTLKIQWEELARLRPGTEAKVLQVDEAWLWCEIATDQDSVQVLTAPSEKKEGEGIPPGTPEKRLLKGWVPTAAVRPGYGPRPLFGAARPKLYWVPTAAVRPGYGGELWWIHALTPELKDLLRRRAQEALKHPSSSVQKAALDILHRTPGADSIPALREALKDKDRGIRCAAAEALGNLGDRDSISALREALKDEHWDVCRAAAEALAKLGEPGIPALREALKDGHWDVRRAAAQALGNLGDRESIPALRDALKDEDFRVREAAAQALAKLGDRESIPALREALKDKDSDVRRAAAGALLMLGEYPKSVSQMVDLAASSGAYGMLELLWPEAKPRFLAGLRSEHEIDWAAHALLHLGHPETIPALIEALHRHGTVEIAEWYLNCGEPSLEAAARSWAGARGYTIRSLPGSPAVRWGQR
jgi:HEAT repeat protein